MSKKRKAEHILGARVGTRARDDKGTARTQEHRTAPRTLRQHLPTPTTSDRDEIIGRTGTPGRATCTSKESQLVYAATRRRAQVVAARAERAGAARWRATRTFRTPTASALRPPGLTPPFPWPFGFLRSEKFKTPPKKGFFYFRISSKKYYFLASQTWTENLVANLKVRVRGCTCTQVSSLRRAPDPIICSLLVCPPATTS